MSPSKKNPLYILQLLILFLSTMYHVYGEAIHRAYRMKNRHIIRPVIVLRMLFDIISSWIPDASEWKRESKDIK